MKKVICLLMVLFALATASLASSQDVINGAIAGSLFKDEKFHTAAVSMNTATYIYTKTNEPILSAILSDNGICFTVLTGLPDVDIVFQFRFSGTIGRDKRDASQRINKVIMHIGTINLIGKRLEVCTQQEDGYIGKPEEGSKSDIFEFRIHSDDKNLTPQIGLASIEAHYDGSENDRTKVLIWTISTKSSHGVHESSIAIPIRGLTPDADTSFQGIYGAVQFFSSLYFKGAGGTSGGFYPLYLGTSISTGFDNPLEQGRKARALQAKADSQQDLVASAVKAAQDQKPQPTTPTPEPTPEVPSSSGSGYRVKEEKTATVPETKKVEESKPQKDYDVFASKDGKKFTLTANHDMIIRLTTLDGSEALYYASDPTKKFDHLKFKVKVGQKIILPLISDKINVTASWEVNGKMIAPQAVNLTNLVKGDKDAK